jgi:hypothetical protein
MVTEKKPALTLYVDRSTQRWIVRDAEGRFWSVSTDEGGWEHRQPFEPSADAELQPIPGHYKYLLRLPF